MNLVTIAGRLGADAEIKQTQGGTEMLVFNVAAEAFSRGAKQTVWWSCRVFGKRANTLSAFLHKGTQVTVMGAMDVPQISEKGDRIFMGMNVSEIALQGSPNTKPAAQLAQQQPVQQQLPVDNGDFNDDIPF